MKRSAKNGISRAFIRPAWAIAVLLFVAMVVLYFLDIRTTRESTFLLMLFNLLFCSPAAFLAAYLAIRGYLFEGEMSLVFIGSGMLAWGLTTALVGPLGHDTNGQLTVHNIGVCIAASLSLTGALWALSAGADEKKRFSSSDWPPAVAYIGSGLAIFLLIWAADHRLMPPFFIPGFGPTLLRQLVLGAAIVQFALAAVILRALYARSRLAFLDWYSLGLTLLSVGLLGVCLTTPGTPLNWTARSAQFLAGSYILIALITARGKSGWRISLEKALGESEQRYRQLFENMSEGFALHEIICDDAGRPVNYRFLDINPAFEETTGLKRRNVIGRLVTEVIPGIETPWIEAYGRVALTGRPERFENFSAGLDRYYEALAFRPAPRQFAVIFSDVTGRRKAQRLHAAILDTVRSGFWLSDMRGKILDVNDAYCEMSGYTRKEILRMRIADFEVKEPPEEILKHIAHVKEHGHDEFETRHRRKNGTVFNAEIRTSYLDIEGGRLVAFAWDITERKHMEERLRLNEELLLQSRELIEAVTKGTNVIIAAQDTGLRYTYFNEAYRDEIKRLTGKEVRVGLSMSDLFSDFPEQRTVAVREWNRVLQGESSSRRIEFGDPHSYSRIYNAYHTPLRNPEGTIVGAGEVAMDVTEQVRAEEQLHNVNRTLKAFSNSSRALVRAADEQKYLQEICRIIFEDCGHAMVWIGLAENDEKKSVRPVAQAGFEAGYLDTLNITWEDSERGRGPTGTAIRTGRPGLCRNIPTDPAFGPWRAEALKRGYASSLVLPLTSEGRTFGALNIYSPKPDGFSDEEINLLSKLADDLAYGITYMRLREQSARAEAVLARDKETLERLVDEKSRELVAAELELGRARRLSDIGTLAATVAHELRNPLAAIGIAAHNIRTKAKNTDLEKHLATIGKKVTDSERIIGNLLFYSRLRPPQYEKTNIAAIVRDCLELMQGKHPAGITLTQNLDLIENVCLEVDPHQITEVFCNILGNAYDAVSTENGRIEIESVDKSNEIEIAFRDNGCGIDEESLRRVYDPFFTTKTQGTGLGLSVCRQIISMHGGSIAIESNPDRGTRVIVHLPKRDH